MDITFIIPVYNEVENTEILASKLFEVLNNINKSYEIIFINDGSTDGTGQVLSKLSREFEQIEVIEFNKNYGKTAALSAGFKKSRGNIIITMDGDLQNDPVDIPKFIEKIEEGYDAVSGWRIDRKDHPVLNNIPSKIANKIISIFTGVKIKDNGCFFKAFRREAIDELDLYGEMHRFIIPLVAIEGAKIAEIPVLHHQRKYGKSKYNIGKTLQVILDLLTVMFFKNFITKPLHMFGKLGFIILFIAFLFGCAAFYKKYFLHREFILEYIVVVSILCISGIQFITTGIIAEILVRVYYKALKKDTYKIRKNNDFSGES